RCAGSPLPSGHYRCRQWLHGRLGSRKIPRGGGPVMAASLAEAPSAVVARPNRGIHCLVIQITPRCDRSREDGVEATQDGAASPKLMDTPKPFDMKLHGFVTTPVR